MGAGAVPGYRRSGDNGADGDDGKKQGLDDETTPSGGRVHPAKVADAVQPGWQRVLEIPSDKNLTWQGAGAGLLGGGVKVLKTHPVGVVAVLMDLAVAAKSGAKNVAGKVLQGGFAGAGRLGMDYPVVVPDGSGDEGMEGRM